MVRTWIFVALAASGCSFRTNESVRDAPVVDAIDASGDALADAAIDAPPALPQMDFGDGTFVVHLSTRPTAAKKLPATINTDTSSLCTGTASWVDSSQPTDTCFIVATDITSAGGMTTVTGSQPLVLLATGTITLSQILNASSDRAMTTGAGGNYNLCPSYPQNPGPNGNGGGGGAGGSFVVAGNDGGKGDTGSGGASAQNGTAAAASGTPTFLRGGCAGQKGGNGGAGNGGNGGGALYLVAGTSIAIGASIDASGGGGAHGNSASGGSGGGSGGMIVLFAPQITTSNSPQIFANGGGGSSGGDGLMAGHPGSDGLNPVLALLTATGSLGAGGHGGDGAIIFIPAAAGQSGTANLGGGGGGGGTGYIRSNQAINDLNLSPSVDVVP
jgi:hypothetical protein